MPLGPHACDEKDAMSTNDKISEAGRKARFEQWEQIGVDAIRSDLLLTGGDRLVGGPPAVRELAREWVKLKEQEQAERAEKVLLLKPAAWGVGIDLPALWRSMKRRLGSGS
jgi:hypothetical protein